MAAAACNAAVSVTAGAADAAEKCKMALSTDAVIYNLEQNFLHLHYIAEPNQ